MEKSILYAKITVSQKNRFRTGLIKLILHVFVIYLLWLSIANCKQT